MTRGRWIPRVDASWRTFAGAAVALGSVVAMWELPVSAWPICLAAGAVVGLYLAEYRKARPARAEKAGQRSMSRAAVVATSAFVCLAATGMTAAFGVAGVLCVAAVAVSSPPARTRLARWFPRDQRPVTDGAAAGATHAPASMPELPRDAGRLSDTELCQVWARTYPRLERARSAAAWSEVIDHRAALLTELERRDPSGFARWIASGARAPSNPLRFLTARDVP